MKRIIYIAAVALCMMACGSGMQYMEVHTYTPQKSIDSLTTLNGFIMIPYDMWKNRFTFTTSDSTAMVITSNEVKFKCKTYTISVLETADRKPIVRFRRR